MKYFSKPQQKGFTLVEMIVALAIFAIVALVAIGALLKVTDANKKSQSLKTAINNLNFALESMSREMRVGFNYACYENSAPAIGNIVTNKDCNTIDSNWIIAFNSSHKITTPTECNLVYAYKYIKYVSGSENTGKIKKFEQKDCSDPVDLNDDSRYAEVVSKNVHITNSIMKVNSVNVRPKAFFWFKGFTGTRARDITEFELQTTVSQRAI